MPDYTTIIDFLKEHFDAIITVFVTILGFIITYSMTKNSVKDEIYKTQRAINVEELKELPYQICEMMDRILGKGEKAFTLTDYTELMANVLAYGSRDAVNIAIHMQQISYELTKSKVEDKKWELLAAFSLLFTQIKFDLTSEIISPESWCLLKINDYHTLRDEIKTKINAIVDKLGLNQSFYV